MSETPAVLVAAVQWWTSKRPARWTTLQHIVQPCANCRGSDEFALAIAVAEYLKSRKTGEINK